MSARGWALFAAMSVIWDIRYLLIKVAVEGVSVPVQVLATRRPDADPVAATSETTGTAPR